MFPDFGYWSAWRQTSGQLKTSGCLASSRHNIWMAAWVFHFLTGCLVSCRHKLRLWLHPCNSPRGCQAGSRFPLLQLTFLQENFAFCTRLAVLLLRNRFVTQKIKRGKKPKTKHPQLTCKGCMLKQGLAGAGEFQNHYCPASSVSKCYTTLARGGWPEREEGHQPIQSDSHFRHRITLPGCQRRCFLRDWM